MSKKDVEIYYKQIVDQYSEMVDNVKEMEGYVSTHMVDSETLDKMKTMLEPIKNNYMTLSYIMFLLNKPTKKKKEARYASQNKKVLSKIEEKNTKTGILKENKECLKKFKATMEDK